MTALTLIAQFILGATAFFVFFGALFNGRESLMISAGIGGLAVTLLVSTLAARRSRLTGVLAALCFAAPALLFAVFALGDLVVEGDAKPFLFWLGAGLSAFTAGLAGVLAVRLTR